MNFIASRSLVYIKNDPKQIFLEDIENDLVKKFEQAVNRLSPDIEFYFGKADDHTYYHFNFKNLELLHKFTEAIYLQGEIKDLFKHTMIYAKKNNFAFYSPTTNLNHFFIGETNPARLKRNFFIEIKNSSQKFHATTAQHKAAIPLYSELLGLEHTICVSAFYSFEDNIRHVQTLFSDYNENFNSQYNAVLNRYGEYFRNRNEYNDQIGIRMIRGFGDSYAEKPLHTVNEIYNYLPERLRQIQLKLIY